MKPRENQILHGTRQCAGAGYFAEPPAIEPRAVASQLAAATRLRPGLAIVLGSGFGGVASALAVDREIPYAKLPGFAPVTVAGHAGALLVGRLAGVPVLVLAGRAHFYEGHSMDTITFPVRVLAAFGVHALLLTNAAGGINRRFRPGDFMLVRDHINFMWANPLRGCRHAGLAQFIDLSWTYDSELNNLLRHAAKRVGVRLREGVYMAVSGPSYETSAEVRAYARLGADAIGMSTVPEAIVARQCGLRVAAVSCITNLAGGLAEKSLSHEEVLEVAEKAKPTAVALLKHFVTLYGQRR